MKSYPHLRLTRGLAAKTNWFNINDGRKSGVVIGLSIQEDNAEILGQQPNGRMDKQRLNSIFDGIVSCLNDIGYSDIISNPKNGTVNIPGATSGDKIRIKMKLLEYERQVGGMGLLAPSSTYHHFAVGLTGDKMSSSKPKTTIFLGDGVDSVTKKIKRAYSGGQSTVEEHRRLGGNPDVDVAYQYMMYFFEDDDDFLQSVNADYRSGKILAGEMKQLCIDRAVEWFEEMNEKRSSSEHLVKEFLSQDSI